MRIRGNTVLLIQPPGQVRKCECFLPVHGFCTLAEFLLRECITAFHQLFFVSIYLFDYFRLCVAYHSNSKVASIGDMFIHIGMQVLSSIVSTIVSTVFHVLKK